MTLIKTCLKWLLGEHGGTLREWQEQQREENGVKGVA